MTLDTYAYGFPRLGRKREYKKLIEGFWRGDISSGDLDEGLRDLQRAVISTYAAHVDSYPLGEMTRYDHMLDAAILAGCYGPEDNKAYYDLCRGQKALEMTKWFNTNYHYLVPDLLDRDTGDLQPGSYRPAVNRGGKDRGNLYFIGPFTFLKLSKGIRGEAWPAWSERIAEIYRHALDACISVHLDEPAFGLELSAEEIATIELMYSTMAESTFRMNVFVYYDSVVFLEKLLSLPVSGIGLDLVHGRANLDEIEKIGFPEEKTLYAGLVDGRNVWKTDIEAAADDVERLSRCVKKLVVSNGSPLFHVPVSLKGEQLDKSLRNQLSFAEEKLAEIDIIARICKGESGESKREAIDHFRDERVQKRMNRLKKEDFERSVDYERRNALQSEKLDLPLFPTTTIGSFPQTSDVRQARAKYRSGKLGNDAYNEFIRGKIDDAIHLQEEIGLDVLVHGEFERSDMVEFFAEKLEGIATTKNGWIISYGTRGYRPPIIYGDVKRTVPLTVDEISYALRATKKPVKGMLTGPVTILAWSYVRNDIPVHEVAYQIALSLRDEISDLEKEGIQIIQVDEPAFREMAPNKKRDWDDYFDWATKAFRLATSGARPETQIHSHMCYSEFGDIIDRILKMNFDVISIEATRSRGDVLRSFEKVDFDRKIGLGVWDIHSPHVPSEQEIMEVVGRALRVIPRENFWINPDCGLKTRSWDETEASLRNMVAAARRLRDREQ